MMDPIFLADHEARLELRSGRSIEQWLQHTDERTYRTISWLRIDPADGGAVTVTLFEVFDDGSPDFLDIYEFEAVDPEAPYGTSSSFADVDAAFNYVRDVARAATDRFVRAGDIQLLYSRFLVAHPRRPLSDR
jgi:hypothetical protein